MPSHKNRPPRRIARNAEGSQRDSLALKGFLERTAGTIPHTQWWGIPVSPPLSSHPDRLYFIPERELLLFQLMNSRLLLCALAAFVCLWTSAGFAVDAFPKQPKMSAAYKRLSSALVQIEKSKLEEPVKHRKNALVDLAMAKNFLDDAAKNKGSYANSAVKLIEEATQALAETPVDAVRKEQALALIKKAQEQVSRGAQAANH